MKIINNLSVIFILFFLANVKANNIEFNEWLISLKKLALNNQISSKTFDTVMSDVKFLPKVIEYDRYQPEFYEDTKTYIAKRTSKKKIKKGVELYLNNKGLIDLVSKKYSVEKELLLALMGIETNFGTYVGKMDIISSLATLSFDKRRSKFFTNELITILQLVERDIIDHRILYGSWAGAFGYFQFMPTTINKYAIDFNNNDRIELKEINDSFASAANYLDKMGWNNNEPCFVKIELKKNIPIKFLNTSAKGIKNKMKLEFFKKYIVNYDSLLLDEKLLTGIITPDKDIVPDAKNLNPAYLIFNNYELILKWNRSLRFALAVCTLKKGISNEL